MSPLKSVCCLKFGPCILQKTRTRTSDQVFSWIAIRIECPSAKSPTEKKLYGSGKHTSGLLEAARQTFGTPRILQLEIYLTMKAQQFFISGLRK
uniref:Uncharacterized protein n=1 Tax=Ditylenchus dipsaci TaxID=166011 RepID=A0A915DUR9_9BILA